MKKFNFKRIITMGIAAVMAVSAMSISAFAADETETSNIVVDENTPVGTKFELASGFTLEVIDEETFDKIQAKIDRMDMARATDYHWSYSNISVLSNPFNTSFKLTKTYPYYHTVLKNTQSSSTYTTMAVFKGTDYAEDVPVYGGAIVALYNRKALSAGTYNFRLSSTKSMSGSVSGFVAETYSEVGFQG